MKSPLPDKLHIGCFDCPVDGWLNTDITPHIAISKIPGLPTLLHRLGKMDEHRLRQHEAGIFRKVNYLDLSKKFPFPSGSFQYVFSSHVFEHIPRRIMPALLAEILRVLKPGGVMRVSVPDLSYFVRNYQPADADEFVRGVFEIEQAGDKNRHQWMYSNVTMIKLLEDAGFSSVRECDFREGACPDLEKLDNRPSHSIFVEGTK